MEQENVNYIQRSVNRSLLSLLSIGTCSCRMKFLYDFAFTHLTASGFSLWRHTGLHFA